MINYLQSLLNLPDSPELEMLKNDYLAVLWHIDDVISRAGDTYPDQVVSKEEAQEILRTMDQRHDASQGITWDVMDVWIEDLMSSREDQ